MKSLSQLMRLACALAVLNTAHAVAASTTAPATRPAAWSARPDDTLKAAAAQGRDTLVWFSGSGWRAESDAVEPALLAPAFVETAGHRFALARADFPAGREGDREGGGDVDPRLTRLAERLGVTTLPALIALDSAGRPYGTVVTPAGDTAACLRLIDTLSAEKAARDAAFASAASLTGRDRAAALARGLTHVGPFVRDFYTAVVAEVVSLDPKDELGLKQKYAPLLSEAEIDKVVQTEIYPLLDQSRFGDVIKRIDKLLAESRPTPEQRQLLIAFKAQTAYSNGDQAQALRWLDDAAAIEPNGPAAARIAKAKAQILETPAVKSDVK